MSKWPVYSILGAFHLTVCFRLFGGSVLPGHTSKHCTPDLFSYGRSKNYGSTWGLRWCPDQGVSCTSQVWTGP